MYIERKADGLSGGDAHIGRVWFSKTGRTLYYGGRTFVPYNGFKANYYEEESGEDYWISGCKRNGEDRLYGEAVPVEVDGDVRAEYWTTIRGMPERSAEAIANR